MKIGNKDKDINIKNRTYYFFDDIINIRKKRYEKIKKYEKLWIKIRYLIRSITKNLDDYDEKNI